MGRAFRFITDAFWAGIVLCWVTTVAVAQGLSETVQSVSTVSPVAPERHFCALGVSIPQPLPTDDVGIWRTNWHAAVAVGEALLGKLEQSGFTMVRLGNLPVGESSIQGNYSIPELTDRFVLSCKNHSLKIWAGVLHPILQAPVRVSDVDCLEDASTAQAWSNAVATVQHPEELMLAAPWDPRLEILLQRRLRLWGRSFNPYTGLRRVNDPAFALWSFEQVWWEDFQTGEPLPIPAYFQETLETAWNNWLYEHFVTDARLRKDLSDMPKDASIEKGRIPWMDARVCPTCANAKKTAGKCPRRREQNRFLLSIYTRHILRLKQPFVNLSETVWQSPLAMSYNLRHDNLPKGPTAFFVPYEGGSATSVSWKGDEETAQGNQTPPVQICPLMQVPEQDPFLLSTVTNVLSRGIMVLAVPPSEHAGHRYFASQLFRLGQPRPSEGRIDTPSFAFLDGMAVTNGMTVAFEQIQVSLSNLVFSVEAPEPPIRLFFSCETSQNVPLPDASKAVLAWYAATEDAPLKPLGVQGTLWIPNLNKRHVQVFDGEGCAVELPEEAVNTTDNTLTLRAEDTVFRIELSTPTRLIPKF